MQIPTRTVNLLLSVLCFVLIVFLFVGDVPFEGRVWDKLWNLGHVLLFAVLTVLLWQARLVASLGRVQKSLLIVSVTCVLAVVSETLQILVQREFSFQDMGYDLAGSALALLQLNRLPVVQRLMGSLALALFVCWPVFAELWVQYQMKTRWPYLIGAVDETELSLIETDGDAVVNTELEAVSIKLRTTHYSGFMLLSVHRDWRQYGSIKLQLSANTDGMELHCHLSDYDYELNSANFAERFNTVIEVTKTPHVYSFNLDEAKRLPVGRLMDQSRMRGVGCFVVDQKARETLFLHRIWLEK